MFRRVQLPVFRTVAKGFATKSVQPPIQLYGLDGTYASALYIAASKDSSVEKVSASLAALKKLLSEDKRAAVVLQDPSLTQADKKEAIDIVTKAVGGDKIIRGFLDVLAQNGRLPLLTDAIGQFEKLAQAEKGQVEATITSAKPLDAATLKRLHAAIAGSKFVGKGKTLELQTIVDPEIKGGLIVNVGDRTLDLSVSSQVHKYNQLLSEAI